MQKELSRLMAEARERHGLTQEQLGQLMGLQRAAVSKKESNALDLSTDEMLTLTQLFGDSFELGLEHVITGLVAELAARIRTLLEADPFGPEKYATRDWLCQTLHKLDTSYVGAAT